METKTNVIKALLNVQKGITALKKDAQGYGYDYLSGDKLLSHVKPLMNENGLLLVPEIIDVKSEMMEYTVYDKIRKVDVRKKEIMYHLTMLMTFTHESGETLTCRWYANGMNDFEKGYGSALTYSERYFLMKFFHIPTDRDDIDNPERKDNKTHNIVVESQPIEQPVQNNKTEQPPQSNKVDLSDYAGRANAMINTYRAATTEEERNKVKVSIMKTFMKDTGFPKEIVDEVKRQLGI